MGITGVVAAIRVMLVLAETTGSDTIYYLHGLDLVAQSDTVSTEYMLYDGLGSVRQLSDGAGTPLLTQTYDPYGTVYASAGSGASSAGYTGEFTDANGLVYLRARYYQPGLGRFFQLDPSRQEVNPYQYSLSNPANLFDPSGLCPESSDLDHDDCIEARDRLESTYGVLIYYRKRPDQLALIKELSVISDWACNTRQPVRLGPGHVLHPWTSSELNAIEDGLRHIANEVGKDYLASVLKGAIFFRVWMLPGSAHAVACRSGICISDPANPYYAMNIFEGAPYSFAFSGDWSSRTGDIGEKRAFTLIHEVGHMVGWDVDPSMRMRNRLYRQYWIRNHVAPTDYAKKNASEFFADTFAIYIWERQYSSWPPPSRFSSAVPLRNVIRNHGRSNLEDDFYNRFISRLD